MRRIMGVLLILVLLAAALPAAADRTVTISFTGDVTLGSEEFNVGKENSFHGYAAREGYGYFFKNMKEMFESDDLTLVNLEGVLSDSPWQENKTKTFRFRGPTDFVRILTESGIEACNISNNHIMDFGKQGYESTLNTLRDNGLLVCGNEYSFIFEKDGIRIGFLALSNQFFSQYHEQVGETAKRMREAGVNAIVCSFHSGVEYAPRRRDLDQVRYAHRAVEDWGVDLVVMHHPHVVQGVDRINQRYVFYSLGNFCFGGNMVIRSQTNKPYVRSLESMVLQMDLRFSDSGTYLGQSGRIYPCYISSSAEKTGDPNDFQPKFVTGDQALGVIERIQADTLFDLGLLDEDLGYLELPYLAAGAKE